MTSFRKRAPWLFLGVADLAYRQPIRPETVADAAVRVLEQLNELRRGEFEESLGAALAEHDALWADELKDGVCDALAVQIELHLARLLERSFDGVDMIVLKAQPGGLSAALANDVLSRSGLMGRAPARVDYATDLLRSGLSAAETFLSVARTVMGADNDLLEDDELEPPWRDADDPDALSMFFDRHADAYLDRRPDAAADQLESHLRRRLRRELAKRHRRAEGLADHGLLRHLGADDAKIAQCKLSNALHEALKRRPISQRLDRLMLDEVSEKFLMALTHRFLNPAPDEEADADRPPSLAAFLRYGVERRFELILRIEGLGHASRYAGFLAFQPMERADFDAVETAIAHVAALAARLGGDGRASALSLSAKESP